ncbi:MAG: hypothetical protein F2737_01490 [Actinobacteria bacterium]|uniref:Unannotated protein n=1 Tax=freshwater metagenome TaxID=449393 RepID=A0A6J6X5T5_9ZZZZ|nr:hypothetical protein [Actinomycetota bacterium]
MQTLISYTSDSQGYLQWLERGKPDDVPSDVPFRLPAGTRNGDRYLLYVGGVDQAYVGWGTVLSDWTVGRSGGWKGEEYVLDHTRMFRTPVRAARVLELTGLKAPRSMKVVDPATADVLWSAVRSKQGDGIKSAMEGIRTESRSINRNASLRAAAIARSQGMCECCGTNYSKVAGGLGRRCLVVHHKKQLKDSDQPVETKLDELAVVCANCHMMIHADPNKAMKVGRLRQRMRGRE